jgi:hypothetical protein
MEVNGEGLVDGSMVVADPSVMDDAARLRERQ